MHFLVAVSLLLSFVLSLSSGEKCCETIDIELGEDASTRQGITVGIYKGNKTSELTGKLTYNKENSNLSIYYHPNIGEEYRRRWIVAVQLPGQPVPFYFK